MFIKCGILKCFMRTWEKTHVTLGTPQSRHGASSERVAVLLQRYSSAGYIRCHSRSLQRGLRHMFVARIDRCWAASGADKKCRQGHSRDALQVVFPSVNTKFHSSRSLELPTDVKTVNNLALCCTSRQACKHRKFYTVCGFNDALRVRPASEAPGSTSPPFAFRNDSVVSNKLRFPRFFGCPASRAKNVGHGLLCCTIEAGKTRQPWKIYVT